MSESRDKNMRLLKGIVIKDKKDNFVDNSRQFSKFFLTTTTTTCVNNLRSNQPTRALKGIVIKDKKDNFVDNSRQFSEFFLTTT